MCIAAVGGVAADGDGAAAIPSSAPASASLPCRVRGRYWAPQRPLRRPALATDLGRGDRACRGPAATGSERKNRYSGFADERQQIIRESTPGAVVKPRPVVLTATVPNVSGCWRVTPNTCGTTTVMLIAPASALGSR